MIDQAFVRGMGWAEFEAWFRLQWRPGEHVGLIGPTGTGKTTAAVAILPLRRYVLALDPKGGDSTLALAGFRRLVEWPGARQMDRLLEQDEEAGRPSHFLVGPIVQNGRDRAKLIKAQRAALTDAFDMGGWSVYVDELQIATDKRMHDLGMEVETLLIAARNKGVSLVSAWQAPRWVPRAAADQATWLICWHTRDTDVVARLGEMAGRPRAEMRGMLKALEPHSVVVFGRDPRQPVIVTRAPMAI